MNKDDNILINSQSPQLWDSVAETYSEVANTSEIKLGQEIEQLFLGLGIEPGSSLLEVGCGSGHLSGYLAGRGYQTTLIDFSKVALEKAKRYYEQNNLPGNFIHEDMFNLSVDLVEPHDVVWNSGVLEHFDAWKVIDVLKRMGQVARKYVIVLVPNAMSVPYLLFRRYSMEKGKWIWGRELLRDSMKHLAEAAGLEVIEEQYIGRHFSYDQFEYVNSEVGAKYQDIDQQLLPRKQNYLIALIARPKERETSVNYEKIIEDVLRTESKIETDTYYFDFSSINFYHQKNRNKIEELQCSTIELRSQLEGKDLKISELEDLSADLKLKLEIKNEEVTKLRQNEFNIENELNERNKEIFQLKEIIDISCREKDEIIKNCELYANSLKNELDRIHALKSWKLANGCANYYSAVRSIPKVAKSSTFNLAGKIIPNKMKKKIAKNETVKSRQDLSTPENLFQKKSYTTKTQEKKEGLVNILAPTFFNSSGNDMFFGGAERYIIELVRLIRDMGYEVNVYQQGLFDWVRFYKDIKVMGLNTNGYDQELLNRKFHHEVPQGELTIYLAFFLAHPYSYENSIGISHGIYWDNEHFQKRAIINEDANEIKTALEAIRNCSTLVSVDTNTINWLRANELKEGAKCIYVPNFVDLSQFYPKNSKNKDSLVVLYPRRLYSPRGFWLVEKNIEYFIKKYPQIEFHFVGKADEKEAIKVNELKDRYLNNIKWYNLPPEEMHKAYHSADITLIPTTESEGTSLSCLEAMACGNAIISTNVGGLPNLIIDGYNGVLIEPNSEELKEKLELLIENKKLREQLQVNAISVSKQFSKEIWIGKWKKILTKHLPVRHQEDISLKEPNFIFVNLSAGGIKWSVMKQRPQQLCEQIAKRNIYTFFTVENDENERQYSSHYLQIVTDRDELYLEQPVLYIYFPYNYEKIKNYKNPFIVYDILDDIEIYKQSDLDNNLPENKTAEFYQEKLLAEADIVITTANNLYEKYKNIRNDIILVPNGVNYEDFNKNSYTCPPDFPSKDKPIIGYYGAIANWIDFELIGYIASSRPDYKFIFIGPVSDKRWDDICKIHNNIIYLGEKNYNELPDYLHYFDVAIIPFVINEVTKSTSPIKLFEYMAGGKPIVTTDMNECRKYKSVFHSKTFTEFADNLDKALSLKNDKDYLLLLETEAKENTWEMRANTIIEAVSKKFN